MLSKFKPTWTIESIFNITQAEIKRRGIRVILTDLDNTLMAWNNADGDQKLRAWLRTMDQAEIPVVVVSNNNPGRVEKAVRPLGIPYFARSLKPLTRWIRRAQRKYQLGNDEVVLVGDQLITDIWGANRAGIRSVLVKPLVESDNWNTKLNRVVERQIKRLLNRQGYVFDWRHSLDED